MARGPGWLSELIAPLVCGLLGAVALWAGAHAYQTYIPSLLKRMDISVGEVLKDRGVRLERAGAMYEAEAAYRQALAGVFNGTEHRTEAQERLGRIRLRQGDFEAASRLLHSASTGERSRASARTAYYIALYRTGEYETLSKLLMTFPMDSKGPFADEVVYARSLLRCDSLDTGLDQMTPSRLRSLYGECRYVVAKALVSSGRNHEAAPLLLSYIAEGGRHSDAEARRLWRELTQQDPCTVLTSLEDLSVWLTSRPQLW